MNLSFLPDPLHPALVHFPIVLILLGAFVAVLALFLKGRSAAVTAAALLLVGALAGWVAEDTGGDAAHESHTDPKSVERHLIHEHADAAHWTLKLAWPAAAAAVVAAFFLFRSADRKIILGLQIVAALLAVMAAAAVLVTAKRGGALVYEHGIGVHAASGAAPAAPAAAGKHGDDE